MADLIKAPLAADLIIIVSGLVGVLWRAFVGRVDDDRAKGLTAARFWYSEAWQIRLPPDAALDGSQWAGDRDLVPILLVPLRYNTLTSYQLKTSSKH